MYILISFAVMVFDSPMTPVLTSHGLFAEYEMCEARIIKYAKDRPTFSLNFDKDSVTLVERTQKMNQGFTCIKAER